MWSDLALPWQACVELAWEAHCAGTVPIGAVVVDPAGRIVSRGRNRIMAPREANLQYLSGMKMAHAEINALLALDHQANPRECTLYTTVEPCPMCAGAIVMADIRHVCFAARDTWAGSTNLYTANDYLSSKHMRVEGPAAPEFEAVLYALLTEHALREKLLRQSTADPFTKFGPLLDCMRQANAPGMELGLRIARYSTLDQMRAAGYTASQVIDALAAELIL